MATAVVTCFLRNEAAVLLFRRGETVGPGKGLWGGVTGHAEDSPDGAARGEVREGGDGRPELDVRNPTFDVTPADVVTVVGEADGR